MHDMQKPSYCHPDEPWRRRRDISHKHSCPARVISLFLNPEPPLRKGLPPPIRLNPILGKFNRLLWIHPFIDGNGRVARLYSHAYLKIIGIGRSLWSVSRGLARNAEEYKTRLDAADAPRQGDLDGRGSLSQKGLEDFCVFFLNICIDQVDFMESLLKPAELIRRVEIYTGEEVRAKRLPKGSFPLLREALLAGEFERGKATSLTGYKDRQARTVLKELLEKGLLTSRNVKGPVRLGFPIDIVERWFPSLYP